MFSPKSLFRFGLKLLALLYLTDRYFLPGDKVKKAPEGLDQRQITFSDTDKTDLFNSDGQLAIQGWAPNGEKYIRDNAHEASVAMYYPEYSYLKNRDLNIFFIKTPDHYIEVLVPITIGTVDIIALVSIVGINKDDKETYLKQVKQEK